MFRNIVTLFKAHKALACFVVISSRLPRAVLSLSLLRQHDHSFRESATKFATLGRRQAFSVAAATTTTTVLTITTINPTWAAGTDRSIASRFERDVLTEPPPTSIRTEFNGAANLYYPSWLEGTWRVTQTLVDVRAPLGERFLGGPDADPRVAQTVLEESRRQIGRPVSLRLRWVRTMPFGNVAEDRLYNTRQRLDAFAGKPVVASVEYNDVGGSNRRGVLALGGRDTDPLQTTTTRFKGPAAQKTFVIAYGCDDTNTNNNKNNNNNINNDNNNNTLVWTGYELDRAIFALTNQNTAPPVTTDSELIWTFRTTATNRETVTARLRIAEYLNAQNDKLYFEARGRAVSLLDYTLEMTRIDADQ